MKSDEIAKDMLLLILFIIILFVWQLAHILLAHHIDFMSTNHHEQQTKLTNVDEAKLTYPNDTQLADNDSTEIDYTIRLVLANTDDLEKENDRPDIR